MFFFYYYKPWHSSSQTDLVVIFRSLTSSRSFCVAHCSPAPCLHLGMSPVRIPSHNRRALTDRNSLLDTGRAVVFRCSISCRRCCSTPFSAARHLYEQGDGTTVSLIFKAARLVNALIFMYISESIIPAPLHCSNKLPRNFHMNLHFYSHYFWFYSGECLFVLCARCVGRSEIRLELARIQCLAQRHLSRLGDCYCGPRAQLHCPATPTLTVDMNFKESVVHWIFLSCTFVLGLSKEAESNQWLLSANRKLQLLCQCLRWPVTDGETVAT